jgi:hypothetical protein
VGQFMINGLVGPDGRAGVFAALAVPVVQTQVLILIRQAIVCVA